MTARIIKYLAIILISVHTLSGSDLKYEPEKPQALQTVDFNYIPDKRFSFVNDFKIVIYVFNKNDVLPHANEIVLTGSGKSFAAKFTIPSDAVFALIKVDAPDKYFNLFDDNYGNFWDLIVFKDDKPVGYGNFKAGVSWLGSMPANLNRKVDFSKAAEYFVKELKYYPDNVQAGIGYVSNQFDMKRMTSDGFKERMEAFVDGDYHKNDENDVMAVSRALNALNRTAEADALENNFAKTHTNSSLGEELAMVNLAKAKSMKAFTDVVLDYLKKYPHSPNREKIFSALTTSYLQVGKYNELITLLGKLKDVPPTTYGQLTMSLLKDQKVLKGKSDTERASEAKKIYDRFIKNVIYDDNYGRNSVMKPKYYSDTEWMNDRKLIRSSLAGIAAEIFIQAKDDPAALDLYKKSLELAGFNAGEHQYEEVIELSREQHDIAGAYQTADMALLHSKQSDTITKAFKELYLMLKPDEKDRLDDVLDSLDQQAKNIRFTKLQFSEVAPEEASGSFMTLDDRIYDFDDLKGKVALVTFWSTWCSPCQAIFPAIENLYYKYLNSDNVVIMALDIWEKEQDRKNAIYKFLENNNYEFPVFFDANDLIPRKIGIAGLPTIVFIDKNGKVRFIEAGFEDEEDFGRDAVDKIEYLQKN